MANPLILRTTEQGETLGPAMAALPTERMRKFVCALVTLGCSQAKAAELAGYQCSNSNNFGAVGHTLAHDARVQAAIHEECLKVVRSSGPMALRVLISVAQDRNCAPRDRIKAATELLNRGGLHAVSQHNISVTHQTDAEKDREILALATELGLDDKAKAKLLGKPVIRDAEFVEIVDPPLPHIAPPRGKSGRPVSSKTETAEGRAKARARYHETLEEKKARQARSREERRERCRQEYAAAQARRIGRIGLEDLLGDAPPSPTEPQRADVPSDNFNPENGASEND